MFYELSDQLRKRVYFTYVCEEIKRHPEKFEIIKNNIKEYKDLNIPMDPMYYIRMDNLIASGLDTFCSVMTERSERGCDLRQVVPGYRIISEDERMYIMKNYKTLGENIDVLYDVVSKMFKE